jgi:hypothetical protein
LAIYGAQELLEGLLAAGHPAGVEGVFGHGGWAAAPLAGLVAAVLVALLRGVDAAEPVQLLRAIGRLRQRGLPLDQRVPAAPVLPAAAALARYLAGRAPPLSAV